MNDPRELQREPALRQTGPVELRMPADPDLVFDADRDAVWERAMARRLREL